MEQQYIYGWQLRPEEDLEIEVRIEAPSVLIARREMALFLEHHDGLSWTICGVRRLSLGHSDQGTGPDVTFVGRAPH